VCSDFDKHARGSTISYLLLAGSVVSVDSIWHVFLHLSAPVNYQYFNQKTCTGNISFKEHGFEVASSSHNDCQRGFIKLLATGNWIVPVIEGQPVEEEPKWLKTWRKDTSKNIDLSGIVNIPKDFDR